MQALQIVTINQDPTILNKQSFVLCGHFSSVPSVTVEYKFYSYKAFQFYLNILKCKNGVQWKPTDFFLRETRSIIFIHSYHYN